MSRIVGFGAERIEPPVHATREEIIYRRRVMLARCLNLKTAVAFLGAGCSVPLGYPRWPAFAHGVLKATADALEQTTDPHNREYRAQIEQMSARLTAAEKPAAPDLLFYLGRCQRIATALRKSGITDPYADYVQRTFGPQAPDPRRSNSGENPHLALLDLPISRFITTNYDVELELALSARSPRLRPHYGLDSEMAGDDAPADLTRLSFTQKEAYYDQLAIFALGEVPATRNMVFHCHGRYDDPETIVATEADYQRWYLADNEPASATFRQSLTLLFGSNPILFLGYGMEDNDLLQPLRMFIASGSASGRSRSRSLFALMPESDAAAGDKNEQMYDRYGVNVIPYPAPKTDAPPDEWGRRLCEELANIRKSWRSTRDEFVKKPVIRKVTVSVPPPKPYLHYALERSREADIAPDRTRQDLDALRELIAKPGIVAVHGLGGTGKSWRVLELLDQVSSNPRGLHFTGMFFWSSYYANDWLTGIDRALAYMEEGAEPARATRMERFRKCLEKRYLVVFDGFERLLRSEGTVAEGTPYSRAVTKLLEYAASGKATVILTTRLLPAAVKSSDRVRDFPMRRVVTADLVEGETFASLMRDGLSGDDVSALCSLCDGHSYALALAAAHIGAEGRDAVVERMQELRYALSDVSPARRISHVIQRVVSDVRARAGEGAYELLEQLSMFMSPATQAALNVCRDQEPALEKTVDELLRARLIFRVNAHPDSGSEPGYTVHPTVRGVMLHRETNETLPNFTLAGFTSGNAPVYPGDGHAVVLFTDIFYKLAAAADEALDGNDVARARNLCRSAFSVLRSRTEANTAARWTDYDKYLNIGITLTNLLKRVSPPMWDYLERTHAQTKEHLDGPLYADELAWLWNDIGLAFYAQGAMADAYAVWELGHEIDRVTDSEEEGGQYIIQSRLEMAGVFLEMGRLGASAEYLDQTQRANDKFEDHDYAGRILGYRALLAHLRGNFDEANSLYRAAVEKLRTTGRNLRALSIFFQHWADLKIAQREFASARDHVHSSSSLADEGDHVDLVAYARNTEAHLMRVEQDYRGAQEVYAATLATARRIGIHRLQSDVLSEMARLALALGDWETARSRAMASLAIANELSLGLRRTHGLLVLGLAMKHAGNPALAVAYLRHAFSLAKIQGYQLRAHEAERELRALGAEIPSDRAHENPGRREGGKA